MWLKQAIKKKKGQMQMSEPHVLTAGASKEREQTYFPIPEAPAAAHIAAWTKTKVMCLSAFQAARICGPDNHLALLCHKEV